MLALVLAFITAHQVHGYNTIDVTECQRLKGCVIEPANCPLSQATSCAQMLITYSKNGDYIDMEMMRREGPNNVEYAAVGFSTDRGMGNEPVTACVFDKATGQASAYLSMNPARNNQNVQDQFVDLQTVQSGRANGYAYCHIRQRIQPRQTNTQFIKPLNQAYYLLLAMGPAQGRTVQYHNQARWSSTNQIRMTDYQGAAAAESEPEPEPGAETGHVHIDHSGHAHGAHDHGDGRKHGSTLISIAPLTCLMALAVKLLL